MDSNNKPKQTNSKPSTSNWKRTNTTPPEKAETLVKRRKFFASSLEEIDQMTEDEIKSARLGGCSRVRLRELLKIGLNYTAAKRQVFKENFQKAQARPQKPQRLEYQRTSAQETARQDTKSSKRLSFTDLTPRQVSQLRNKARTDEVSFKEALTSVKVAVVAVGYPENKMSPERLGQVQDSISEAHDKIPIEGKQVRFAKCTHKPGYLVVTCVDRTSADWLRDVVTTIQPWKGATLKALELEGDDIPRPLVCTTFIPDERGQSLEEKKILKRLKIANHRLNTHLWTVWGRTPSDKGQTWAFLMDRESLDELKKLHMSPYYALWRLKFNVKHSSEKVNNPGGRREEDTEESSIEEDY